MSSTPSSGPNTQSTSHRQPARDESRSRGRLELNRRVVEKIAAQATREIPSAGGQSGGVLGFNSHADTSALPKVDVDLTGRTARVAVEVALAYPVSLAASAEQIRVHVMDRVKQFAGVEVSRVDVVVTSLSRPQHQGRALR